MRSELAGQALDAVDEAGQQAVGRAGGDVGDAGEQFADHDGELTAGQVGAEAEVRAVREGQMVSRVGTADVEAVRIGLNRAYAVRDSRPWWLLRLESIAYVFVGAFSLLTLAFLVVLAPLIWAAVLHFAPGLEPLNRLITVGRFAIASLVLLLALVLSHKFLPAGRRSLREIAPGILLTFALWIAAGIAFGSYLAQFARNYVTTYAGLASVMIALVFLYMIASIFIFGGELNAAILRAKRKRDGNMKVQRAMRGSW